MSFSGTPLHKLGGAGDRTSHLPVTSQAALRPVLLADAASVGGMWMCMNVNLRSAGQPKVSAFPEVDENMCVEGAFLMQMN